MMTNGKIICIIKPIGGIGEYVNIGEIFSLMYSEEYDAYSISSMSKRVVTYSIREEELKYFKSLRDFNLDKLI